ncbi:DUF4249 domain-containing protein [Telluribacter sp. SYSU D00476]|uniref:DUF4249 domain-containing protein n=1 Tax=Telluribacter sp. SYSU D00476 TaxID=2811430 RepID=UPI001FF64B42|nr:DUF4249 domain-containing protein [Telluribacter sp. SYSU D00476]
MKKRYSLNTYLYLLLLLVVSPWLVSCEDVIDLNVEEGPELLVVDGWITNQPGPQRIRLTLSSGYFNNSEPQPALNADVTVTDDQGKVYVFEDTNSNGVYEWTPQKADSLNTSDALGHIGRSYTLLVRYAGEEYTATSAIKRVPVIDSLVYQFETLPFTPPNGPKEGYIAEFYARDFSGIGDTYWIKALRGGGLYANDPENITLAFDAAFSPGSVSDGLVFIQPLRRSINVNQLFSAGDTVGVELHSITPETYYFLQQVRQESSNGGIFATPPANIFTNIRNSNPNGRKALGYFGTSAISRAETIIDPAKARPDRD